MSWAGLPPPYNIMKKTGSLCIHKSSCSSNTEITSLNPRRITVFAASIPSIMVYRQRVISTVYLGRRHWSGNGLANHGGAPVIRESGPVAAVVRDGAGRSQLGRGAVVCSSQDWHIVYGRGYRKETQGQFHLWYRATCTTPHSSIRMYMIFSEEYTMYVQSTILVLYGHYTCFLSLFNLALYEAKIKHN